MTQKSAGEIIESLKNLRNENNLESYIRGFELIKNELCQFPEELSKWAVYWMYLFLQHYILQTCGKRKDYVTCIFYYSVEFFQVVIKVESKFDGFLGWILMILGAFVNWSRKTDFNRFVNQIPGISCDVLSACLLVGDYPTQLHGFQLLEELFKFLDPKEVVSLQQKLNTRFGITFEKGFKDPRASLKRFNVKMNSNSTLYFFQARALNFALKRQLNTNLWINLHFFSRTVLIQGSCEDKNNTEFSIKCRIDNYGLGKKSPILVLWINNWLSKNITFSEDLLFIALNDDTFEDLKRNTNLLDKMIHNKSCEEAISDIESLPNVGTPSATNIIEENYSDKENNIAVKPDLLIDPKTGLITESHLNTEIVQESIPVETNVVVEESIPVETNVLNTTRVLRARKNKSYSYESNSDDEMEIYRIRKKRSYKPRVKKAKTRTINIIHNVSLPSSQTEEFQLHLPNDNSMELEDIQQPRSNVNWNTSTPEISLATGYLPEKRAIFTELPITNTACNIQSPEPIVVPTKTTKHANSFVTPKAKRKKEAVRVKSPPVSVPKGLDIPVLQKTDNCYSSEAQHSDDLKDKLNTQFLKEMFEKWLDKNVQFIQPEVPTASTSNPLPTGINFKIPTEQPSASTSYQKEIQIEIFKFLEEYKLGENFLINAFTSFEKTFTAMTMNPIMCANSEQMQKMHECFLNVFQFGFYRAKMNKK